QAFLQNHYASDQVPDPQLQSGNNWDRVQDPSLDLALAAAGGTVDDAARRANYTAFAEQVRSDVAVIPLYPLLQVDARKSYVQGWGSTNVNDNVTWNIQDWWLSR